MPKAEKIRPSDLEFRPLTRETWPDFERLFGPNGACAGCWCMWWRLPRSEFRRRSGEGNRLAFRQLVEDGPPPGVIPYDRDTPAGWEHGRASWRGGGCEKG